MLRLSKLEWKIFSSIKILKVRPIFDMELMIDEIRQTLVDFRNGVAQISQRLVTKPEGSRGGTPQGGR
jgi:hypothetical protein